MIIRIISDALTKEYEIPDSLAVNFGDEDNFPGEQHKAIGRLLNVGEIGCSLVAIRNDFIDQFNLDIELVVNGTTIYTTHANKIIYLFSKQKDENTYSESITFTA